MSDLRIDQLIEQATKLRWNRRQILKRATVLGLSAPAISVVLAACGGDDDDDDGDDPTAPAAATTPAAAAPTDTAQSGQATEPPGSPTQGADATATTDTAATQPPAASGGGGTINVADNDGDNGIGNPIITGGITTGVWKVPLVFNRLVHFDDEGNLSPELATDWSWSDDNLELTLTLAEAKWHDGEDFDAEDVIFTFDALSAETTDSSIKSRIQIGGEFVAWEAVDARTVKITVPEPFAPFLGNLNYVFIVPEHRLAGVEDINTDSFNLEPIGTGPFKMVEWVVEQFTRYERFDEYFLGTPKADGFTVFYQADTDVSAAALEAGEIDMMFTPPELQPNYVDSSDFTLYNYVYYMPITLAFNHKHPIFQDINVRRAIAMAIDKQALMESVTKGRGIVAHNQFADTGPLDQFNDYDNVAPVEFNLEEANRILDEAGYARGDDGIRVSPDGERFAFNIVTYQGFEEYVNSQIILQEMLGEVGMELTPQVLEFATLEGMWADPNDDPKNRALELEEWPHALEFDPDLYNELHTDSFPPGLNYMWFSDEECDRLINEGRTTIDPDKRVEVYRQLDVRRAEVIPSVPLYDVVDGWVLSNKMQGIKDTPYFRQYRLIDLHSWWKED